MKVLSGNETPEQLMIYLKNYEDKIYKNAVLTAPEKLTILKRIVDKEAQTIVSEVESDYGKYVDPEDVDEIKDHKVQINIRATYTTDNQTRVYFAASGLAAAKKKKVKKSSGIQPFLFTPEEWPKDAPEQIIETTEGRNRLK